MAGRRRTLYVPISLLAVLAVLTTYMAVSHSLITNQNNALVSHTYQVIDANQRTFVAIQNAEIHTRAYVLTGDESYRRAFKTSTETFGSALAELERLVRDNASQTARVAALRAAAQARLATLASAQALAAAGQPDLATATVEGGRSGDRIGPLRATVREIGAEERRLLAERSEQVLAEEHRGFLFAGLLSLVVLLALGFAIAAMVRANRALTAEVQRRAEAEAAQREAAELLRTVFLHAPEYLVMIDVADGAFRVADINPAFERASGLKAGRVRGADVRQAFGVHGERLHELYGRVAGEDRVLSITERIEEFPGGPMTLETVLAPVRDSGGRLVRIISSSRDITAREAMEQQLRQAQRMEAVGQLTGGVAHDFNNLLQVIGANLEMISPVVADNPKAHKQLRNAIHGAGRAAQLTRQMLAFARRQPLEPRVVNLGRLVGDMAEMMRRTIGESVEIETVIAGGLWNTIADPAQVESAVLNLAINARDAMPDGGRLTIELANAALDDAYAEIEGDVSAGQYVMLAVSDTGAGMPADVAARVFEPFFTTKAEGKGTGLGLSMVYGFVKQSNGHVKIYSEPGAGTTVKIYLPRSRKAVEDQLAPAEAPPPAGGQTILVVEDDEAVRAAAVSMLQDIGYRCIEADSAKAGLDIVQTDAQIDLLFTDVIMPGSLKTRDFTAQAAALRPGLPVLYTSGYTENAIVHHGRLDEGVHLLSKPYSRNDLARKVAQILNAARTTVLVVEDDALVRSAAADMLSDMNLAVIAVADAPAALAHLESGARVDVLFTDVGLPGMRGPALAEAARAMRPGLKVVFASGYGGGEETDAVEGAWRLGKPYQQRDLVKLMKAVL